MGGSRCQSKTISLLETADITMTLSWLKFGHYWMDDREPRSEREGSSSASSSKQRTRNPKRRVMVRKGITFGDIIQVY